jgi:hypothetical protein
VQLGTGQPDSDDSEEQPRVKEMVSVRRSDRNAVQMAPEARIIRPGDTLLVRMPGNFTASQAETVSKALREQLPGVKVCVLTGVDGLDVCRPE